MFDEKLYQETISALHASEDTLSEVMNMTHKTKRRGRLHTTAVLAAVIAILCCMAAAAAALGLDQRLAEYFGATAEQEELLSTAAVPMNIVKRDSGAVMRIEQVIADRYCAAVLIDFTAPDGTVLDQDYYAFDRSVSATSRDGVKMDTYGIGWEVLPSSTEDETGRHATILMTNMTHKTKRRGRLHTTAVLAAVIAILCCMAAAAAALGLDQRLAEYFGATAEQEELLSTAAVPMNIVKRDSGAVMRIEQVIADRYCAAVLIDFTAPDGTVLDQDYYAFDRSVSATSRDGVKMDTYGIGWEVLPSSTEDETGRHATILMTIHSLKGEFNFIGAKVKLTLDGLYRDNCLEELVVPGRWSCTFTLPETDPGRLCTVNEPIEIEGKNAVLTTFYVSPLSLTCEIKQGTDDLKETVEPIYSDDGKESIAPEVTLQNGETVGAADWLFLITNYADKRGRYCFQMDEILDPETVSNVTVFGETFSIE